MSAEDLSERARAVLYAVITEFIATGEPVGSRTLTKKHGFDLSAATIRNVLADLEDAGYLSQPHTSAGRVPTEAAFRVFIDALMRVRQLSRRDALRISEWFEDLPPGVDLLRETGKLLSSLSGAAAILVRLRSDNRTVLRIRFIATRPGELLSVIVFSDGTVENRFIAVDKPLNDGELDRIHNMLERVVEGWTLAAVRDYFRKGVEEHRDELNRLHNLGLSLASATIEGCDRTSEVVIEGQAKLLDRPEFQGADRVRELMRTLEDRARLVNLLDRALESSRVQVFLGNQTASAPGCPVSLVAAPYHEDNGEPGGAVGIIGPTRMDYSFVVPLVGATAEAMSGALARSREGASRPSVQSTSDGSAGD
ncbi:MAG TPA: heat-inducible transcriptional repressor HrcA [Polyangiaceae bacterium]|jgi:heat-inducible transcriptional repressor